MPDSAGFLSTFITRGMALPDASIALRRKRLAAAISRLAVSKSRSFARWNPALDTDISPHLSLYVRLVDQIAPIERLQIRTAGFVQLGRIYLHPTPKCNWRLINATLGHQLRDVFIRQWVSEVQTHAQMISSPGCCRPLNGLFGPIGIELYPTSRSAAKFATEPLDFAFGKDIDRASLNT